MFRRFSHLLTAVNEDGTRARPELDGGGGESDPRAVSTPAAVVGDADLIVILHVAERVPEGGRVGEGRGEVVGPLGTVLDVLEEPVGGVVVDGVETCGDQRFERAAIAQLVWVVVVGFGHEAGAGAACAGAGDGPGPEFRRDPMRHVAAESVDAKVLPMRQHGVHAQPGVGNRMGGIQRRGEVPRCLLTEGEVETVIELHGFVPVVDGGPRRGDVVAGHTGLDRLRGEASVASAEDLAGGADCSSVADGRELEGTLAGQMEEVVRRAEEAGRVVRKAEVEIGSHHASVRAGNVVGNEVDEDPEPGRVDPSDEFAELLVAAGWIRGVVRTNVEDVADGVGRAGDSLEEIGVIGGQADMGMVSAGGLAWDAEQPEVSDAEVAQGLQGERGQVIELAHAVLGEGAVWATGFAKVGELAEMQEIDARTHRSIVGGGSGQRKSGGRRSGNGGPACRAMPATEAGRTGFKAWTVRREHGQGRS